jgi:hypothetical protein
MDCLHHDSIDHISILVTGRGRVIKGIVIVSSLEKKLMAGNFVVTSLLNAALRMYNYTVILKKFRQLNLVNHFIHLLFYSQKRFAFKTE